MNSELDRVIADTAEEFVTKLAKLNSEPYIREAIMKMAVREVVWAFVEQFEVKHELADHLEAMADVVRGHKDGR